MTKRAPESGSHLFFEGCVARSAWKILTEVTGYPLIKCFEDLGKLWLRGKNFSVINVFVRKLTRPKINLIIQVSM
jgi:hypothetical protein